MSHTIRSVRAVAVAVAVLAASARFARPSTFIHRVAVPLLVLALGGVALALALTRSIGTTLTGTLVGGVLLAIGAREARRRAVRVGRPA